MPDVNLLIFLKFHILSILECTVFCASMHIFLCITGQGRRAGNRDQRSDIRGQGSGVRDQVSGIRCRGSGIRAQVSGIRCRGSGIRDQGSGVWVQELGVKGRRQRTDVEGQRGKSRGLKTGIRK
jgi:hypothetical protein